MGDPHPFPPFPRSQPCPSPIPHGAVDDLVADTYPAVELWQTERYALDLVQSAFGRPVQLDTTAAPAS